MEQQFRREINFHLAYLTYVLDTIHLNHGFNKQKQKRGIFFKGKFKEQFFGGCQLEFWTCSRSRKKATNSFTNMIPYTF